MSSKPGGLSAARWGRVGAACVLLALPACGGDGTGPDKVASVVITGAPTTAFLVGDSVRLSAQPVTATGGVVVGQAVHWTSSAPAVASVRPDGTALALSPGQAVITASAGGGSGTVTLAVSDGATIGQQGGTLSAAGGAVKLVVPVGVLTQPTLFVVNAATPSPPDERIVPGTVWQVGPDFAAFVAALTLRYDPAKVPAGLLQRSLQLYTLRSGSWVVMWDGTVDTVAKTLTAYVLVPGTYAVRSTPVDHILLSGLAAGGALYPGQTGQLSTTLYNNQGDTLPSRTLTWSSSDPGTVSVDGTGKVTAVGAGSATITAATDGKSASTTVQVLVRPTADWSRAGEWTTFQGNAAHTGYVDATLDPVVFQLAWTASLVAEGQLLSPSASGGRVFVTGYFYPPRLFALDASSGSTLWSYDAFDPYDIMDPPAYADGSVYMQSAGVQTSYVYALDAATGQVRFRSGFGNQMNTYYAPVIVGQTIFAAGGYYGGMFAYSTVDGAPRWSVSTNQYDHWTPAVGAGRVYAYTGEDNPQVQVVDAVTGSVLDTIADPNFSWNGWSMDIAPVLGGANDLLATQGGRLLSFDLANHRIGYQVKASFYQTVAVAGGVLYVNNNKALEARSQSDGSLLWSWAPPSGRPTQPPVVTNNLLFLTTGSATYAIDLASHRAVWSYPAGGPLALSGRGQLLIAGGDGKLTAIAVK